MVRQQRRWSQEKSALQPFISNSQLEDHEKMHVCDTCYSHPGKETASHTPWHPAPSLGQRKTQSWLVGDPVCWYIIHNNVNLHDPDNHDGVITHLQPDILEREVKWALGSITTNKASGGDGIYLSYFKSWKMMLSKCCTQYASKFGKLTSGHRTGKGQFSFQSQRKAMPKNVQTTTQLPLSHTLAK